MSKEIAIKMIESKIGKPFRPGENMVYRAVLPAHQPRPDLSFLCQLIEELIK